MKRWPLNKAHFWEQAPFFRLLLPFAAGILCYEHLWLSSVPGQYIGAVVLATFVLYLILASRKEHLYRVVSFSILNTFLFFSGIAFTYLSDTRNNKDWFGKNIKNDNTYLARISDEPAEKEASWKLPVTVINAMNNGKTTCVNGKALLYLYKDGSMHLHKGDTVMIAGDWELIKNAGNPFEFDYAAYCGYNGLYYRQFASIDNVRLYAAGTKADVSLTEKAHTWCMHQFDKYISNIKTAGLIEAMILGDEVNLDEETREKYADTGIIHIIAISGGNVAIFFIIISFLLWWLKHKKHLWVKYAIALPLVWFYVMMAGASPSAIRAAVMFSLFAFAIMFQKNNNSLNGIFTTAFILLLAQPMWAFSLGFQLSFAAVLSLIIFYKHIYRWVSPTNKISRLLWGTVAASIAAQILTAPLIIYYFHSFPPLFIIANAAAYLFMGLVLILSIAILVTSFIPAVASFLATCLVYIVEMFDNILTVLQHFSPSSFRMLLLTGAETILVYVIVAAISVFLISKKKQGLMLSLGAACILMCSFCVGEWRQLTHENLVVYNIAGGNYIEYIHSNACQQITSTHSKKAEYAIKPAHIHWQLQSLEQPNGTQIFSIAGKTILVLDRNINTSEHFPVDVVILNYTGKPDPQQLKQVFAPKVVVAGNNYTQTQQKQLVKAFANSGIYLHSTANNGAYIFSRGF